MPYTRYSTRSHSALHQVPAQRDTRRMAVSILDIPPLPALAMLARSAAQPLACPTMTMTCDSRLPSLPTYLLRIYCSPVAAYCGIKSS